MSVHMHVLHCVRGCGKIRVCDPDVDLIHAWLVLSGKALKDIPAVVTLIGLHTIKKTDPKDPLKVCRNHLFPSL